LSYYQDWPENIPEWKQLVKKRILLFEPLFRKTEKLYSALRGVEIS